MISISRRLPAEVRSGLRKDTICLSYGRVPSQQVLCVLTWRRHRQPRERSNDTKRPEAVEPSQPQAHC